MVDRAGSRSGCLPAFDGENDMENTKKPFSLKKAVIISAVCLALAVAFIVGTVFANIYEGLITVWFSGGAIEATEEEKELCEQIEAEGIVLLKNEDGALPLGDEEKKLALLGQDSVDFVYGGAGSGSVDASLAPTMKEALEGSGFTVNGTLWDFYDTGAGSGYRKTFPNASGDGEFAVNEVPRASVPSDVVSSMDGDDVGIVVIGRSGGESADLPTSPLPTGYLYLEPDKNELDTIALACEKFDKVVLVINSSTPVELGVLEDPAYANVKAALWVGAVGQEGMHAIGDVLAGRVNPSGRLVDTYAYDSLSAPSNYNLGDYNIVNSTVQNGTKYIVYQEGIYVGYRYYETRYEDAVLGSGNAGDYDYASEVQFPFGYGLSYSEFGWSDYSMTENADGDFEITLTVTNNGGYSGKDVVQIYMSSPYTEYDKTHGVEKSAVELVGFAKTGLLEAGASEEVTIVVDRSAMKAYDAHGAGTYIVDDGVYYFAAAKNAHEAVNSVLLAKDAGVGDKLVGSGDASLVAAYTQEEFDAETYSVSEVTENAIVNRFDDVDVNYYEDCTYLSRSDWEGTMPDGAFAGGSWTASAEMLADLEFYRADEVINDPEAQMPVNDSTATAFTVQELIDREYGDECWTQIVEQLSWSQMTRLVRLGGYSTIQIDKIGLPMTQDKDGPSGFSNTLVGGVSTMSWPTEVVMASTWNTELMEKMGEMLGDQSIAAGVAGWYAPGVNIHRSPYSGRNFEYYGEDGFLSGKIGAAEMRGVRSKGVIAYMKHFALNDQETNRYGGAVFANEQSIREIYLKGFEYCVTEGGAIAAMAGMNRIGARWVGAHKGIMTDVLRGEWGFEGMVITDQASVRSMLYQDMISGLWAGTDLWLNTDGSLWSLDEWKDNATVMSNVRRAASNVIYAVTKSNAVINYGSGGGAINAPAGMPAWKIWLIVVDVIVFAACAAGIAVSVIFYVKGRKKAE